MAESAALSTPDLVLYLVVVLFPMLVFWAALAIPRLVEWYSRRRRTVPTAHGPPIEQLAEDLRRVHRVLTHLPPGTTIVRWRATRHAYDTLLMQVCEAVEVPHQLDELPPEGFDREVERLRVEEALRAAGITVR